MKFMLNGTVTLGTMDGANVEICEEAGIENNYIFGARVEDVPDIKKFYSPRQILAENPELKRAVETMIDGTFDDEGTGVLRKLYESIVEGYDPDHYLVLYDFADYVRVKEQLLRDYGTDEFYFKSLKNLAHSGKFSADRSVSDYSRLIWHI